jgi:hypothetical protein
VRAGAELVKVRGRPVRALEWSEVVEALIGAALKDLQFD